MIGADRGVAVSLAVTLTVLALRLARALRRRVLILLGVAPFPTILHELRGPKTPVDEVGLRSTPWPAVVVAGVFLGACATFYTLYAGVFAGIACPCWRCGCLSARGCRRGTRPSRRRVPAACDYDHWRLRRTPASWA